MVDVILGGLVVPTLVLAQAVGNPTVVPLERNTFGNPYDAVAGPGQSGHQGGSQWVHNNALR